MTQIYFLRVSDVKVWLDWVLGSRSYQAIIKGSNRAVFSSAAVVLFQIVGRNLFNVVLGLRLPFLDV